MRRPLTICLVACLCQAACVSQVHYDRCVADAAAARAQADARQKQDAARIHELEEGLSSAQATLQDRDASLSNLSTTNHNLQAQLDEATAINAQLRGELERLGHDVDKMLTERGTLSKALDDAKLRLNELRQIQSAAQAREDVFRDLGRRFKPLIDAGQLQVEMRHGRLLVVIDGGLLFDAGRTEIRTAGKGVLMELAHAMQTIPVAVGSHFLVTAFPDDRDPRDHRSKSIWPLTAARAVAVDEYLASLGVQPSALVAAATGSLDPREASAEPEHHPKMRRIEIDLVPSADELVPVSPTPAGEGSVGRVGSDGRPAQ